MALVQPSGHVRVGEDVCTTDNGSVDLAPPQSVASHVKRRQTGTAGGVDCVAWPAELEMIVDAAWDKGSVTAWDEVGINVLSTVGFLQHRQHRDLAIWWNVSSSPSSHY